MWAPFQVLDPLVSSLPVLLHLYWLLCAGAAILALVPLPGLAGFRSAVILSACRGKLLDDVDVAAPLGPLKNATVPQKWFSHFYALGALWNGAVLLSFATVQRKHIINAQDSQMVLVGLALLEVHLVRRFVETVALLRYPTHARMHILAYVYGLSYYFAAPLTLLRFSSHMETWRALANGAGFAESRHCSDLASQIWTACRSLPAVSLVGVGIFFAANLLQINSHSILAGLNTRSHLHPRYHIPKGGAFEWISSPHYLAEILVYVGLALTVDIRRPIFFSMLAWVASNLALAAGMTHQWYLRHFKTYPRQRKALIPHIW